MSALGHYWSQKYRELQCGQCGIVFHAPEAYMAEKEKNAGSWYCPNGHSRVYKETTEAKLRREIESQKRSLEWERSQRQTAEQRLTAQKAQTTKARNQLNRVKNGVCPCCNRTFQNLMRHMETKHPSYSEGQVSADISKSL